MPIPKPKFFERKVPAGLSKDAFFEEIVFRQTHVLRDAIDRVSFIRRFNQIISCKLIYRTAMDPAGILMLRSVRIVFEMVGLAPESMKFKKEEFNSSNLVKALTEKPKKCPVILTFDQLKGDRNMLHAMVTIDALQGFEFMDRSSHVAEEWFIKCKNSYRDEISEPNIVRIPLRRLRREFYSETGYRFPFHDNYALPNHVNYAFYISIEE